MGPADTKPLDGDFQDEVYKTLEYWKIPGMAIAVIDGEDTSTKGYGTPKVASTTKVEPNTLFYGGSTTKAFTAAMMGILVQDNASYPQVQWSTPVAELIREDFVLDQPGTIAQTTIEDILSHRTGMPGHNLALGSVRSNQDVATVQDVVRSLRFLPRAAPPRTTYMYNNAMYIVASHLIQTVTGEHLGALFQRHIWEPLAMNHTYLRLEDAQAHQKDKLATGYDDNLQEVPWKDRQEISGAGAIISSVEDYAKWVFALLNPGQCQDLSAALCSEIGTARTLIPAPSAPFLAPMAYAMGWNRYVYHGVEILTHDGGIDGFGAEIAMVPALKYGVVTMANSTYTSNYGGTCLMYSLIDAKLGIAKQDRFDWKQKYDNLVKQMKAYNANAMDYFYPNLPNQPRPGPTLPLAAYAGIYWDDGYGALELYINQKDKKLHANRTEGTNSTALTFEHVIGDCFLAKVAVVGAEVVVPAEFALLPDRTPRAIGVGWEPNLGKERRIWMRRVGAGGGLLPGDQHQRNLEFYDAYQQSEPELPEFLDSQVFV
ncbi:beta-lactamase/transpeptidase-like protein [Aspergillus unguis]